jgi:hypothetical protein
MDSAKAVRASQFSFDNISLTVENARPFKPIPKLLNPNGFQPPSSLERARFAAIPSNNRSVPQTIQEKLRPWKNSPTVPSTSSDKKALPPNFRYNTKKIPLRMNMPSPLTDKTLGTHSSLLNARPNEGVDAKQKGFRVRNGTSLAKVYTDSSTITTVRTTSRCGKDASQRDISVHSVDSDIAPERVRNSDLGRLKITNNNTFRHTLPLLIIHFEGILGTCLVQAKEEGKESSNTERGKEEVETLQFIIRKGVKSELKALMDHFVIAIVFPSIEKKYKRVAKYMLRNKYCMDGLYYNVKREKIGDFLVSEDFVFNYNLILNDFKVKIVERKVLLVVPLNVSQKIARKEFLLENPANKAGDKEKSSSSRSSHYKVYDEKQFIHFFPKVKASPNNTRIICVPNYTLSDKYERPSLLLKSSFSKLGKMLQFMLTEIISEGLPYHTPQMRAQGDPHSLPLTPLNFNNQLNMKNEVESAVLDKELDIPSQTIENQENKRANKMSVGLHSLNMGSLVEKLDDVIQKSRKWQRMKQIRQSRADQEKEVMPEFNLPEMKNKVIDSLLDMQKQKGMIRSNIMSHFLVGDLFSRNNYLFKFYEKDEFYSKKVQGNIKEMVGVLEESHQGGFLDSLQTWERKEDIMFTPPKKAMSIPTDNNTAGKFGGDDETDSINLLHMRKQIKTILLYLEN